jgi:hypothetical protein
LGDEMDEDLEKDPVKLKKRIDDLFNESELV